jgi:hypothetical protein
VEAEHGRRRRDRDRGDRLPLDPSFWLGLIFLLVFG